MKTIDRGELPMILRLVLVGLVGALGVTLPSRMECEDWFESARVWASARLADWDTWRPRGAESISVARVPIPPRLDVTLDEGRPMVSSGAKPDPAIPFQSPDRSVRRQIVRVATGEKTAGTEGSPDSALIAFESIPADGSLLARAAFELYRITEGLENQSSLMAVGATPPTVLAPVLSTDSVELKLVVEMCLMMERSELDGTVPAPAILRRSETDPFDPIYEENAEGYESSAERWASNVQPDSPRGVAGPNFDPIDPPADLANRIADELNRLSEGMEIRAGATRTAGVRAPLFEPIDLAPRLESGIADELNRASEGLEIVSPGAGEPENREPIRLVGPERSPLPSSNASSAPQSPTQPDLARGSASSCQPRTDHSTVDVTLGQAIRLTRDATLAWMNVLTGPTLVQMTSR
jgi:hypothetical protein